MSPEKAIMDQTKSDFHKNQPVNYLNLSIKLHSPFIGYRFDIGARLLVFKSWLTHFLVKGL